MNGGQRVSRRRLVLGALPLGLVGVTSATGILPPLLPTNAERAQSASAARVRAAFAADSPTNRVFLPMVTRDYRPPFTDDFGNPNSGWPTSDTDVGTRGYIDGEYRIAVKQANKAIYAGNNLLARDFQMAVDVRVSSGANPSPGLYFGSASGGIYVYSINKFGQFGLQRYDASSGEWLLRLGWYLGGSIRPLEQVNRLRVVRRGADISVWANGQVLGETADSIDPQGYVGMALANWGDATEARFDNFAITFDTKVPIL